jgi:hypothetical protein
VAYMGTRTSIYLNDELHEAWKASGVPLAELVRRGEKLARWRERAEAAIRRLEAERDQWKAMAAHPELKVPEHSD